ncbi:midnolin homolog [Phlebotomus argentipes]|uniref:midnolin homolog n=1 Tax=Phlebotomus argentipes TaxID=94469 RepID=UPI002892F1A5|nr:midnolin homolog [Phlebotomus argentipes]
MENSSGSDSRDAPTGCGPEEPITINISTTTGGNFTQAVETHYSVENLKKIVAKKLRVAKDRICLLHRERELQEGTLKENGIVDGSRIILTPNVETGLLAQRPESTVMQALESLNDSQVNDFLSGKSPLNLNMRLGDHMMIIQLQLSTVNPPSSQSGGGSRSRNTHKSRHHHHHHVCQKQSKRRVQAETSPPAEAGPSVEQEPTFNVTTDDPAHSELAELMKQELDDLLTNIQDRAAAATTDDENNAIELDQSPIKSLSNLVSSPIISVPIPNYGVPAEHACPTPPLMGDMEPQPSTSSYPDPISAKLTSCLCKRLDSNSNSNAGCDVNCQQRDEEERPSAPVPPEDFDECHAEPSTSTNATTQTKPWRNSWMHKTANNPITKIKNKNWNARSLDTIKISTETSAPQAPVEEERAATPVREATSEDQVPSTGTTTIDARALAEASRNLTQTLKKLSKEVFTSKVDLTENSSKKIGTGAVIESMKHHGKGIYSGTFSGTLNPALQDRYGRPKRDISTIIHILNDLLSATPQYRRGTSISVEAGSSSSRTSSRQSSRRHHHQQSEMCSKCSKTSRNCPYGECSGHSTSTITASASAPASPSGSCKHSRESWACGVARATDDTAAVRREEAMEVECVKAVPLKCCCQSSQPICSKCSSVELENNKTKVKLDQLKLVMQQKKERREARKLKSAPYSATIQGASVTTSATALAQLASTTTTANPGSAGAPGGNATTPTTASTSSTATADVPQSHIVEEVDTAA